MLHRLTGDYQAAAASHQQALQLMRDAGEPCGAFRVGGRQRVDGIDAVKLTGSRGLVLWIDPATYLPARQVVGGGQPTDFHWRPATAASLAHMRVPVPAGFRQVPAPPPTRTISVHADLDERTRR